MIALVAAVALAVPAPFRDAASVTDVPPVGAPVPAYPLVARLPLTDDAAYWRTQLTLTTPDGVVYRISGSKDRAQGVRDGYFMTFTADGETTPLWVSPDDKPVAFMLGPWKYFVLVDVKGIGKKLSAAFHPEGIKIYFWRDGDTDRLKVTAGEFVKNMRETGVPLDLGGRKYYALYAQNIKEIHGGQPPVQLLATHTLMLLPDVLPKTKADNGVEYDFGWSDRLEFDTAPMEGQLLDGTPAVWPKFFQRRLDGKKVGMAYGFHIVRENGRAVLEIYDMTTYPKDVKPYVPQVFAPAR